MAVTHKTPYRVIYADVDAMGVVYHANYFDMFERVRGEFLRARGCPYPEVEARGYMLPLTEAYAHYLYPAKYDDLLIIETTVAELRRASVRMEYRIWREGEEENLLVTGFTLHPCTTKEGKIVRYPEFLFKVFSD